MAIIENAMNEYHRRTCIRFRPRTYERDYLTITSDPTGCWSSVGRLGGRQVSIQNVSKLSSNCKRKQDQITAKKLLPTFYEKQTILLKLHHSLMIVIIHSNSIYKRQGVWLKLERLSMK